MKITATPTPAIPAARLAQRVRSQALSSALSSRVVQRLKRELEDELDSISSIERGADDEARRDALERAVRRLWGTTL